MILRGAGQARADREGAVGATLGAAAQVECLAAAGHGGCSLFSLLSSSQACPAPLHCFWPETLSFAVSINGTASHPPTSLNGKIYLMPAVRGVKMP